MQIELTEEQKLLRETVRRFAEEVVEPRAKEIDETGEFPRSFFDQAGELGLAGVAVPEEYGGAGMDTVSYCLVDRGDQPRLRHLAASSSRSTTRWSATRCSSSAPRSRSRSS